jgi:lysozyme
MNLAVLQDELIRDEALRFKPYTDREGKLTIGVGRNLTDVGISRDEAMMLLNNDITSAVGALDQLIPWWRQMSEARQHVVVNMCFNLGPQKLMGFRLALAAMESGNYEDAALQMEASEWYNEVGGRAIRLTGQMRAG